MSMHIKDLYMCKLITAKKEQEISEVLIMSSTAIYCHALFINVESQFCQVISGGLDVIFD